jgi:hypothetical protein
MKRLVTLLIIIVCAVLSLGGSFTCHASSHDDVTTHPS